MSERFTVSRLRPHSTGVESTSQTSYTEFLTDPARVATGNVGGGASTT